MKQNGWVKAAATRKTVCDRQIISTWMGRNCCCCSGTLYGTAFYHHGFLIAAMIDQDNRFKSTFTMYPPFLSRLIRSMRRTSRYTLLSPRAGGLHANFKQHLSVKNRFAVVKRMCSSLLQKSLWCTAELLSLTIISFSRLSVVNHCL